jgi:hypothetical protein
MTEDMEKKLHKTAHNHISCSRFHAPHCFRFSRVFCLFIAAFFCLPGTALLWGQEAGYRIEEDGRFVQLLSWEPQESVLYYKVEIEKQAGELWESLLTTETEEPFFESSLPPGAYRYRVRAYDFLERPGLLASEWMQFEIFPAMQPVLVRFSPEGFYLDEADPWVITLSGRNLAGGAAIFLRDSQGGLMRPDTVTVEQSGNEARLTFAYGQLDLGDYAIHVTNPGGLSAEIQTFRVVAFRKPMDITVSAGYRPLVALYGYINELFGTAFFPAGAYSRLSIIPVKQPWGYVGLEIEPSWNYLLARGDTYEAQAQMPGVAICGMYRRLLSGRTMTLGFRIGGGVYSVLDYHLTFDRGSTDSITVLVPFIAAGVSFQWLVKKPFFVEAGLDFTHFFTVDDPSPGYLRPFAGIGWQF